MKKIKINDERAFDRVMEDVSSKYIDLSSMMQWDKAGLPSGKKGSSHDYWFRKYQRAVEKQNNITGGDLTIPVPDLWKDILDEEDIAYLKAATRKEDPKDRFLELKTNQPYVKFADKLNE